ncbi:MAG: 4'-phosphopantetheinyl transferase superfamily protein, partial [Lamprobacter sp.]|uniref:4'-phosphopantetheinyl transferase family protein n=1 Tax=Lamprobacter sp. TaxID=3100796 RepID=UPI002B2596BD
PCLVLKSGAEMVQIAAVCMATIQTGLLVVELALEPWGTAQQALLELLPAEEQSRILRYRRDADRCRSLTAALLPRLLISHQRAQPLAQIHIERGPTGKPFYPADPQLHFNLSHSGQFVALAIGASPVGVDVEQVRPTRDWDAIAKRFFALEEQQWLARFDQAERRRRFVALWSRKESLLKATGEGIAGGLSSFCAIAEEDAEIMIDHHGQRWFLRSYPTLPGYGLALCSGSPGLPPPRRAQVRAAQFLDDIKPAIAALVAMRRVAADAKAP